MPRLVKKHWPVLKKCMCTGVMLMTPWSGFKKKTALSVAMITDMTWRVFKLSFLDMKEWRYVDKMENGSISLARQMRLILALLDSVASAAHRIQKEPL